VNALLQAAELIDARLDKADLSYAVLEGAYLNDAHVENAVLLFTRLTGARLDGAHLVGAERWEAHLDDARLHGAHMGGAKLGGAHLQGAYLLNACLEGVTLDEADLRKATLEGAHLEGAALRKTDLREANLVEAHLDHASLEDARLEGALLDNAYLAGAKLQRARLEGASLYGAHLEGKKTSTIELRRIRLHSPRYPETLPAADLRQAFFGTGTSLDDIVLGDPDYGFVKTADVRWSGTNLAVVSWDLITQNQLGDVDEARKLQELKHAGQLRAEYERKVHDTAEDVVDVRDAQGAADRWLLEKSQAAVRANRQLAVALREQAMSDEADYFAFRAQELQQAVFWAQRRFLRFLLLLFSRWLAGYGYRPLWTLGWYAAVIVVCAALYYVLGDATTVDDAFVGSVTAFHGRGLFQEKLTSWQATVAAIEAFFGLVIEVAFIVTLTQRFFGK
jgi:uncharacterized protein YjbI with pentapeptide repeats